MTEREAEIYAEYAEIIEELQQDVDSDYLETICEMEKQLELKQAA
jgi:hypothetical protein